MKQAFLITAYKNFEALYELSSHLAKAAYVYVHVDKESREIGREELAKLNSIPGCEAFSMYDIPWGGMNHVHAIVALLQKALPNEDVSYLHVITGEDMPVVSMEELNARFLTDKHIYMDVIPQSEFTNAVMKRYRYHNYFQNKNVKNPVLWQLQNLTVIVQRLFGVKRDHIGAFKERQLYKGLVYVSMPKEAARYVISYCDAHGEFMEELADCQIPEEFFFQTILMNAPFREDVSEAPVRYLNWAKGEGGSPAYLDETDYDAIRNGGYAFARKFGKGVSDKLKQMILGDITER